MSILFYGAGVIGSVYAARLKGAGHTVSVLARGQRLADIREHGIVLEHAITGQRTATPVDAVEHLSPGDAYDLVVVAVRKNQLSAVLPALGANADSRHVLFMVNNALGYDEWARAVGLGRLLLGFPGAGGTRQEHIVRYLVAPRLMQPTTFGEPDGRTTPRLKAMVGIFKGAGFPVAISRNMDAWQKSHVAWASPVANAIYMAGGDNYRLAHMPDAVRLMVRAVREGFQVLEALGVPVTPPKLKSWRWVPESIMVALLRRFANTRQFEIMATRHANAARDEMRELGDEFKSLARKTSVPTPAIDQLRMHILPGLASHRGGEGEDKG